MNASAAWALRLLALDPAGLGGLWLRGPAGPARDALLAELSALLPAGTPWRRCPLGIDDARLLGGLDLGLSVAAGRPVVQRGLLADAQGGLLQLGMAERAPPALAGRLAQALDAGGLALLALDEGLPPEEGLAAGLADRLGLVLDIDSLADAAALPPPPATERAAAAARLAALPFDAATAEALCACAQALGIASARAPWQAWRAACAAAAWRGAATVEHVDAELAARLVLAPRARSLPAPPPAEPEAEARTDPVPPSPADAPAAPADASPPAGDTDRPEPAPVEPPLDERLLAAAQAALPPGLLALLAAGLRPRAHGGAGRHGAAASLASSGRPLPPRRGPPRGPQRLDLLATLRAALPWQRLRLQERAQHGLPPAASRWLIRRDDFHARRYRRPAETTTVFVVDASGSQAMSRLAEAKGAVELLLADCYVRRDRVALIAFRGTGAELLLPPTRSLVRAKRALAALPGGGGTPLAAGIEAGGQLASRLQAHGDGRAQLVFLTDGRANVDRQGRGGRPGAMADAEAAARRLAGTGIASLLIDTAARPAPEAATLAAQMGARYLALPQGRAASLHQAVRAAR